MAFDFTSVLTAATSTYQTVTGFSLDLVAVWWTDIIRTFLGGILLFAYNLRYYIIFGGIIVMLFQPVFSSFSLFGLMRVGRYKE